MAQSPGGVALRSKEDIELVKQHVQWLEDLGITNADGHFLVDGLHGLLAEACRPRWLPSENLRFYVPAVLLLVVMPILIGNATVMILGFLGRGRDHRNAHKDDGYGSEMYIKQQNGHFNSAVLYSDLAQLVAGWRRTR